MIEATEKITPMKNPGIKLIKQINLGTTWQPLAPEEFQDNVSPFSKLVKKQKVSDSTPPENITNRPENTNNSSNNTQNEVEGNAQN